MPNTSGKSYIHWTVSYVLRSALETLTDWDHFRPNIDNSAFII